MLVGRSVLPAAEQENGQATEAFQLQSIAGVSAR